MSTSKTRTRFVAIASSVLVLAGGGAAIATNTAGAKPKTKPVAFLQQTADIQDSGPNSTSFDISFVDPTTNTYYLADRSNGAILSINAATDTFNSLIGVGDFSGLNTGANAVSPAQTTACGTSEKGPNGLIALTVGGVNQVWAADGVSAAHPVSNLKVFTINGPTSATLAATIPTAVSANGTNGTCRADEMAYDPRDGLLAVANDVDPTPYISFISVNANPALDTVVAQLKFPIATTSGIEQTVWDPQTRRFYTNIPGIEVAVIDPVSKTVVNTFPSPPGCTAQGLDLDPQTQQLLVSCKVNPNGVYFLDARNGSVTANFPQVSGADQVWFDPGTQNFYLAAGNMTSTGQPLPAVTTAGSGTSWSISEAGATGGTFALTVGTMTTAQIVDNASAATVQSALQAIVPGTLVVGGPLPASLTVAFGAPQTVFTADSSHLQPGGYATPVLGVISGHADDAPGHLRWLENTPLTAGAHSVAADPNNGQVFVPLIGVGVIAYKWVTN